MRIFFLIFMFSFSVLGKAQTADPYYEISELFHARAQRFNCSFVETQVRRIRELSDSALADEIESEISGLSELSSVPTAPQLAQDVQYLSQELRQNNPRERIISGLESLCRTGRRPLLFATRSLALGNSAVLHTLTFPLTGLVSFWNGVFNRKKTELGDRRDEYYRAFGPKRGMGSYTLGVLASEAINFALTPNPVFTALNLSVALEMLTNYSCFQKNDLDPEQVAFCDDYGKLQDFFHQGRSRMFEGGHKLQQLLDKKIMHKRADLEPEKFCGFGKTKQIRRARQVLMRHTYLAQDKRILEAHILLPIHKNECTKLLLYTDTDPKALNKDYSVLEGIRVVVLKKGVFPADYYYSTQDLQSMRFEDSLCYEVETAHFGRDLNGKFSQVSDLLKASLTPSLLAAPETARVVLSDQNLRRGEVRGLRNLIFSIGNDSADEASALALREEQKHLSDQIRRDYKRMLRGGTHSACSDVIRKRKIDLGSFEMTLRRLGEIRRQEKLQRQLEYSAIEKFFKKERRRLNLNWELIRTNSLQQVMSALKSPDVANVVIISHGKDSGHLVDVLGQEFPREAFNQISPSIQSINFYSCYSQKLVDLYGLKNKLSSQPSFHKVRHLTSVGQNDFMGAENFAPISAFGYYIGQLDAYLSRSVKGSQLLQSEFGEKLEPAGESTLCSLDASDLQVKKGSYALTLNDEFVGVVRELDEKRNFEFPCRFYRKGSNSLRVKNVISQGGSVIENLKDFKLELDEQVLDQSHSSLRLNSMVVFKFLR
jgi:hypothetical protein